MATKTVVLLEDDLDGGTADLTVRFSLDGVDYEIDLSVTNAGKLSEILHDYVLAARRVGAPPPARKTLSSGPPPKADPEQLHAIRAWARARGYPVKERGRIPRRIVDEYNSGGTGPAAVAPAAAEAAETPAAAAPDAAQEKVATPRKAVDLRFSGA